MTKYILILFLCLLQKVNAQTYYIAANGSDVNNGTSQATPWPLSKVNTTTFNPGDQILFKRGDIFSGSIIVNQSGTSGSPITFGAYGIGANPVFNGLTTVTQWTNIGTNIWESTNAVSSLSTLKLVLITVKVNFSNPTNIATVTNFWINNYPYAAKITKVVNLDKLTDIPVIDLSQSKSLDAAPVDFSYPSTLTQLVLGTCGLTSFIPAHNLPAGLTSLKLQNNSLNSAAVDATLNWLATQTFNAGTKSLYITQGGSAPPTSASSSALSTLTSNGWVISHD